MQRWGEDPGDLDPKKQLEFVKPKQGRPVKLILIKAAEQSFRMTLAE